MEFCHSFLFVTFVVLTVDQFVERGNGLSVATVYVLVCTTNPQILTVICCIHHPTHPMSKIPFPILNFLDSDVCAVMTLIFLTNLKKCASFSKNVAILLLSFKQPITALNKLIDSQHYKRHKRKRMTEFHSPSHFTLAITQ